MSKNKRQKCRPIWATQNFLTSSQTIDRVIRLTSLNRDDHVIEIGPGKGHITKRLLVTCGLVSAVEIDNRLYNTLNTRFQDSENVRLYHQDFLTWRLPKDGAYKVFSNIPFCFTTDIVRKLTEAENPPVEMWLTMEKGAAKRFLGRPSESLQSLLIKPRFDMGIVYYFRRDDFHPMPGVDVVLLQFRRKREPDVQRNQWRAYSHFVNRAMKSGLPSLFTKTQLLKVCHDIGLHHDTPLASICFVQWLCLFRCYWHHVLGKNPYTVSGKSNAC